MNFKKYFSIVLTLSLCGSGLACASQDLLADKPLPVEPTLTAQSVEADPTATKTLALSEWRDIGTLDNQTAACIAPSAEEFYAERQMEFGGSGGQFSGGSLETVLNSLPFGDCSESEPAFPIFEITQCEGAIAFFNSGGFTLENEFFSTETGELVYASVDTDFNAFCNNASFGLEYGEKPSNQCQTQKVSYCNVDREQILNLYRSKRLFEIVPAILAAQN